jgi:hypothetical protein
LSTLATLETPKKCEKKTCFKLVCRYVTGAHDGVVVSAHFFPGQPILMTSGGGAVHVVNPFAP